MTVGDPRKQVMGRSPWVELCTFGDETLEGQTTRQYRIYQTDPDIPEDERESTTAATKLRARNKKTGKVRLIPYHVHIASGKKVKKAIEKAKKAKDPKDQVQRRGLFLNSNLHFF